MPTIQITDAVWQELTRLAAKDGVRTRAGGNNEAGQYLLLLAACRAVLSAAPSEAAELTEDLIDARLEAGMVRLADLLASLLPGGVPELLELLSPAQRHAGWGSNSFGPDSRRWPERAEES